MGRDLVFMITARLSNLSMPLKGEVRRSPVQSARQPMYDVLIRGERWIVKKTTVLLVCMLSHVCFLPS